MLFGSMSRLSLGQRRHLGDEHEAEQREDHHGQQAAADDAVLAGDDEPAEQPALPVGAVGSWSTLGRRTLIVFCSIWGLYQIMD